MNKEAKAAICEAIRDNKWLHVSYRNVSGEKTFFYIGINDIAIGEKRIYCDIFNPFKNWDDPLVKPRDGKKPNILFDGIESAEILPNSYHQTPKALLLRLGEESTLKEVLEVANFENNILSYLAECYEADADPFLSRDIMVDGLDRHELSGRYKLNDEQYDKILREVLKKPTPQEAESYYRYSELAMNALSLDFSGKIYPIAYYGLCLDFKEKSLVRNKKPSFNKSFLLDKDARVTLSNYVNMNPDEFCLLFLEHEREAISILEENFAHREKVNTRPYLYVNSRNILSGVKAALHAVSKQEEGKRLGPIFKAFFGRNIPSRPKKKENAILVFDRSKINDDQLRVVFNAMNEKITYVQGPPGTGKTETIFNVLLSSYFNGKTVLVSSNNNHPVDDIMAKFRQCFESLKAENEVPFPVLRLGNNEQMRETIWDLRRILSFIDNCQVPTTLRNRVASLKNYLTSSYRRLGANLENYEEILSCAGKIKKLQKMKEYADTYLSSEIDKQLADQAKKFEALHSKKPENLSELAISAKDRNEFNEFIRLSSLQHLSRLKSDYFKELREILDIGDMEKAVTSFNKYLRDDSNLKRFLDVFPIILCTSLSCDKLGSPNPHFSLVVIDEAGQCNLATSFVPLVRGENLLLVGDTKQLQPVTVIETDLNERLREKYQVGKDYDYVRNSIMSTLIRKDKNSKRIMLRYHYRCGRKIAAFANERFYENKLTLLNAAPGYLRYIDVHSPRPDPVRNTSYAEAREIVKLIRKNGYDDVGVITPFKNQADAINALLRQEGIENVSAGTIHTLQGSEKSTIILSAAISPKTAKRTMEWIAENHELINVAVTRAKKELVFVGDKKAIDVLSKGNPNDMSLLSNYVYENGECSVPKLENEFYYSKDNGSEAEAEFFKTIQPYFKRPGSRMEIRRNVPALEALKALNPDESDFMSRYEFDVVIYVVDAMTSRRKFPLVVFEIDGGEHVAQSKTAKRDRLKEKICSKYQVKTLRIANSQVKDYELIIQLFECMINDIPSLDAVNEQLSLFESDEGIQENAR